MNCRARRGIRRGEAISTHLPCQARADRGIPGASLDWQRTRLLPVVSSRGGLPQTRLRRFPQASLPKLFSRAVLAWSTRTSRRHVRILAIEAARRGAAVPRRKGHASETLFSLPYLIKKDSNYKKIRNCKKLADVRSFDISRYLITQIIILDDHN